jgi:endonuclease-3
MDARTFERCLARVRRRRAALDAPVTRLAALGAGDPFRIAVGTLLSPRTRDETLIGVLERLFRVVRAPRDILRLAPRRLERLLRPTGFFRMKTRTLRRFAAALVERHGGRVPAGRDQLLALPGIGPKVAGVVLVAAFGEPAVAVDTHVHRIVNRLGVVRTRTPLETHAALGRILPRRVWPHVNLNLVALGQTICRPTRPLCPRCPLDDVCPKVGVTRPTAPPTKPRPRPTRASS